MSNLADPGFLVFCSVFPRESTPDLIMWDVLYGADKQPSSGNQRGFSRYLQCPVKRRIRIRSTRNS